MLALHRYLMAINASALAQVCAYLRRSGIRRVLVGHKPFGTLPAVVRTDGVEVITADTSFSDVTAPDMRGRAASEVLLEFGPAHSQARIHGCLHDGRAVDFWLPPPDPSPAARPSVLLGQMG